MGFLFMPLFMPLQLNEVSLFFGATQALDSISINIEQGEQVALIGPSGSGKTSLLRIMGAQIMPSAGSINVLGNCLEKINTEDLRALRTHIAMIPQDYALVPNIRVLRNVLNGGIGKMRFIDSLRQMLILKKEEQLQVYHLLERVGISEKIYDRTDSLSGGQQQRVALARALYQKPGILLADEPVASTDPSRARDIIKLLCELSQEEGMTLVVSLHNLEIARDFFPRLIGLREGKVNFDMKAKDLLDSQFDKLYEL